MTDEPELTEAVSSKSKPGAGRKDRLLKGLLIAQYIALVATALFQIYPRVCRLIWPHAPLNRKLLDVLWNVSEASVLLSFFVLVPCTLVVATRARRPPTGLSVWEFWAVVATSLLMFAVQVYAFLLSLPLDNH